MERVCTNLIRYMIIWRWKTVLMVPMFVMAMRRETMIRHRMITTLVFLITLSRHSRAMWQWRMQESKKYRFWFQINVHDNCNECGSSYNNEEICRLVFGLIIWFWIRGDNFCRGLTVAQTRVKGRKTSSKIWNKLNVWILKPRLKISS